MGFCARFVWGFEAIARGFFETLVMFLLLIQKEYMFSMGLKVLSKL